MNYTEPYEVTSPQLNVSRLRPIVDRGEHSWSAALLRWDNTPTVGLRWNGGEEEGRGTPHPGNPQSRGLPTWFVVPDEIVSGVLHALMQHGLGGGRIDTDHAKQWVDEELRSREQDTVRDLISREDFDSRVKEIVKAMKLAGEI